MQLYFGVKGVNVVSLMICSLHRHPYLVAILIAFSLCSFGQMALAQGAIQQLGPVTPGHSSVWMGNGSLGDAGAATNPFLSGVGLYNGAACPFGVSSQTTPGILTTPHSQFSICQTAAATTFNFLGVNGQATPSVLFNIGGVSYGFPGPGNGDVLGPTSSVSGDLACFNTTTGTLIEDCGPRTASNVGALALTGGTLTGTLNITAPAGLGGEVVTQTGVNQDSPGILVMRTVDQTGGTAGFVNPAIQGFTTTSGASNNFEWSILGRVDNSSTGAAQDVGVYGQGRCIVAGCSPTWGGVSEAKDTSGQTNPVHGLLGHEFDIEADGPDVNNNRVIMDAYCKQNDASSTFTVCGYGFRMNTFGNAEYNAAGLIQGNFFAGLQIAGNGGTEDVEALSLTGSYSGPMINAATATSTDAGAEFIRTACGQRWGVEATDTFSVGFESGVCNSSYPSQGVFVFDNGSTEAAGLRMDTGFEALRLRGLDVLGYTTATSSLLLGTTGVPLEVVSSSVKVDNTLAAGAYNVGATAGVSCSGTPTSSFAVTNGIVTHC
jgi:hypothetical protein